DVGGTKFVYRELGLDTGVPVIFLNHLAAELDRWDPRVVDGIATRRRVIVFDNRGIGASEGKTPTSVEAMARDAVAFIRALGFDPGVPSPIEGHPRLGASASCRSVAHSSPGSGGEWRARQDGAQQQLGRHGAPPSERRGRPL